MTFSDLIDITLPTGLKTNLHTGLLINGQFVKSRSGKKVTCAKMEQAQPRARHSSRLLTPRLLHGTGEVITEVYEADKEDVDDAVEAAKNASIDFMDGVERGRLLYKFADLIEGNAATLAAIESMDQGKLYSANMGHVASAAALVRCYAGYADKLEGRTQMDTDKYFNFTRHEPYGVTCGIIPWNYPLDIWVIKVAPSVACGNVIIMKSSEKTPLTALALGALAKEAGFPDGVIQVLSGFGTTCGQALSFTGSGRTGRHILRTAADTNLKRITLELGGKSPAIVFEDADLDMAAGMLASTFFYNNAQTCITPSRVYVQKSIADEFTKKYSAVAQGLKLGNPFEEGTTLGPIIDDIQLNNILKYIEAGKKEGQLILGGNKVAGQGYFLEPTIFSGIPESGKLMAEEIFGPVVCINKFETEDEVVKRANDSTFGLAAGVFTKDLSRAIRVSSALEAGTVWVNTFLVMTPNASVGAYKESGVGGEFGEEALREW
ncbi:aldehyde dehydrogenase (NAD(P)(+)) ald5 [Gonapodya sp. JEL0774]|nr:aldehyde dehydrogenase (NAD(P)(+)) ald5 [Gonapodya sp. JEL0774]